MSGVVNGHGVALGIDLAAAARRATENVWPPPREHTVLPAAGQVAPRGGAERTAFFSRLAIPMQNGTGKVGQK